VPLLDILGETFWPLGVLVGLPPGRSEALPALPLALLAELPQLLLRVLRQSFIFSSISSRTSRNLSSMES
jgi:hypothetical protein